MSVCLSAGPADYLPGWLFARLIISGGLIFDNWFFFTRPWGRIMRNRRFRNPSVKVKVDLKKRSLFRKKWPCKMFIQKLNFPCTGLFSYFCFLSRHIWMRDGLDTGPVWYPRQALMQLMHRQTSSSTYTQQSVLPIWQFFRRVSRICLRKGVNLKLNESLNRSPTPPPLRLMQL